MLEIILDWAVILLPTVLSVVGVLVSIKVPASQHHGRWRIGLVALGVIVSGVTFWQQSRSRSSHQSELAALNKRLEEIEKNTKQPPVVEITNNVPPTQVVVNQPERPSSKDYSRLEYSKVSGLKMTDGGMILRFLYGNRGTIPVVGLMHHEIIFLTERALNSEEISGASSIVRLLRPEQFAELDGDTRQFYSSAEDHFYDMPLSQMQSKAMETHVGFLYGFSAMVYRDSALPKDSYRVTELCNNYRGHIELSFNCGSRSFTERKQNLTTLKSDVDVLSELRTRFPVFR